MRTCVLRKMSFWDKKTNMALSRVSRTSQLCHQHAYSKLSSWKACRKIQENQWYKIGRSTWRTESIISTFSPLVYEQILLPCVLLFGGKVFEGVQNHVLSRNAWDSQSVSKSAANEVGENISGQNHYNEIRNSSLEINEVTREERGQMNVSILDRSGLNRSILVQVHTLEFRGEKYEDMSEGQGIDPFEFFICEMSWVTQYHRDPLQW